jgi:hypothetical protein
MSFPLSTPLAPLTYFSSDRFDQILSQFSKATAHAIHTSNPNCNQIRGLVGHIQYSGIRTKQLTEMMYELCSLVCKNYSTLKYRKSTLLLCLEIGFWHLDHTERQIGAKLVHTEHHQKLAEIVFGQKDAEAIADLLHAWTSYSHPHEPYPSLQICTRYLTGLGNLYQSSPRLRKCAISVIQLSAGRTPEQAGVEGFVGLLNDLQISVDDVSGSLEWLNILLDAIQGSAEPQHLSHSYWELLLEYTAYWADRLRPRRTYNPHVLVTLESSKEWNKLKYWIGVVWMLWPPEGGRTREEDLKHTMFSLSQQKPEAIQELETQMEGLSRKWTWVDIPESFQQICKQAHGDVAQQSAL